jgi:hypothetical protein
MLYAHWKPRTDMFQMHMPEQACCIHSPTLQHCCGCLFHQNARPPNVYPSSCCMASSSSRSCVMTVPECSFSIAATAAAILVPVLCVRVSSVPVCTAVQCRDVWRTLPDCHGSQCMCRHGVFQQTGGYRLFCTAKLCTAQRYINVDSTAVHTVIDVVFGAGGANIPLLYVAPDCRCDSV